MQRTPSSTTPPIKQKEVTKVDQIISEFESKHTTTHYYICRQRVPSIYLHWDRHTTITEY